MVKLRHRLLQKKCSKVMVSQLLSYGEDSDRHGVYPKPDFNRNVTFKLVSIIGAAAVGLTFGRYLSPTLRSVDAVEELSVGLAFGRYLSPTLGVLLQ